LATTRTCGVGRCAISIQQGLPRRREITGGSHLYLRSWRRQITNKTMSATIYWMLVDASQTPAEPGGILSASELAKFSAFHFPKRRDEWLLGRWAAKSLPHSLPKYQDYPLDQIEILNTPEGAPYIQVPGGNREQCCLSLSHSGQLAVCTLTVDQGLRVGVDLEKIETRTETFVLDYFTATERRLVEALAGETRAEAVTLIWSTKESMLKALKVGLRQDTRSVEVRGLEGVPYAHKSNFTWNKIEVGEPNPEGRAWSAWWQRRDQYILTLAGFGATQAEIQSVELVEKQS
jgi:4'-phosphopantetheinyl transferase